MKKYCRVRWLLIAALIAIPFAFIVWRLAPERLYIDAALFERKNNDTLWFDPEDKRDVLPHDQRIISEDVEFSAGEKYIKLKIEPGVAEGWHPSRPRLIVPKSGEGFKIETESGLVATLEHVVTSYPVDRNLLLHQVFAYPGLERLDPDVEQQWLSDNGFSHREYRKRSFVPELSFHFIGDELDRLDTFKVLDRNDPFPRKENSLSNQHEVSPAHERILSRPVAQWHDSPVDMYFQVSPSRYQKCDLLPKLGDSVALDGFDVGLFFMQEIDADLDGYSYSKDSARYERGKKNQSTTIIGLEFYNRTSFLHAAYVRAHLGNEEILENAKLVNDSIWQPFEFACKSEEIVKIEIAVFNASEYVHIPLAKIPGLPSGNYQVDNLLDTIITYIESTPNARYNIFAFAAEVAGLECYFRIDDDGSASYKGRKLGSIVQSEMRRNDVFRLVVNGGVLETEEVSVDWLWRRLIHW